MDYGYANARIRGMKSRLLDHKALNELILKPDIGSLILELENTPYKDDILEAGMKYSGITCIEYALRNNYTKTFKKILSFVEGKEAEIYIKIFLRRWDVQNIKTILRGKSIHATPEEIYDCLFPAGDLDEITLSEMIKQPDIRGVIDMLATWRIEYAKPLTVNFKKYSDEHDLIVLESALEKYNYEKAFKLVAGDSYDEKLIREFLSTEIDVINLKTALRMIRDKIDVEEAKRFFIEGGRRLRIEDIVWMINTRTIKDAIERLNDTPYHILIDVPEEYFKKEKISVFEKELDKFLIKKGNSAFNYDPLSIAIAIGYFWAKFNEITNIRIISRFKTADFPEEKLKEELIYV